jgi:hypothetical protein
VVTENDELLALRRLGLADLDQNRLVRGEHEVKIDHESQRLAEPAQSF